MLGYIGGYIANRDFGFTSMGVTAVAIKAAKVWDKQYKRVEFGWSAFADFAVGSALPELELTTFAAQLLRVRQS